MADKTGVARLRQAIENQASEGEACFSLPIGEAAAICVECEGELGALSWAKGVTIPVDADDEVVPLDTEKLYTDDGEMVRVDSICHGARLWRVRRMHSDKTYWLDSLHLRRPDSWEQLEEDVERYETQECICAYYNGDSRYCDKCKSPARSNGGDCLYTIARDILRRTKALAERDMKEASRD